MDSPLKYDANTVKEFDINEDIDLDPTLKLGFARTQFDEIKKMLWRERIDLILAEAQAKLYADNKVEAMAAEARNKIASYRNNIKGYVTTLNTLKTLVAELDGQTGSSTTEEV